MTNAPIFPFFDTCSFDAKAQLITVQTPQNTERIHLKILPTAKQKRRRRKSSASFMFKDN